MSYETRTYHVLPTASWLSLDRRRFSVTLDWLEETPGYELSHASLEDGVRLIKWLLSRERLAPACFWIDHRVGKRP